MKPILDFKCDQCPATFPTKRDLSNHTVKAKHIEMKLVCPWCYGNTAREFSYSQDLRRHVKSYHPVQHDSLPPRALSTRNCFFFCRDPANYYRMNGASDYESDEAKFARNLIAKWTTGRTPGYTAWRDSWQAAISAKSSSTTSSARRSVHHSTSSTSSMTTTTTSDSRSFTTTSINRSSNTSSSTDQSSSKAPSDPTSSEHPSPAPSSASLKRSRLPDITICAICLSPAEAKCHLSYGEDILLVRLTPSIFSDQRALSSLTRRMCHLSPDFHQPTGAWKFVVNDSLKSSAAEALGIDLQHVSVILRQPAENFKVPKTSESTCIETKTSTSPSTDTPATPTATVTIPTSTATATFPTSEIPTTATTQTESTPTEQPTTSTQKTLTDDNNNNNNEEHLIADTISERSLRTPTPVSLLDPASTTPSYHPESPVPPFFSPSISTPSYEPTTSTTTTTTTSLPIEVISTPPIYTPAFVSTRPSAPIYTPTPRNSTNHEMLQTRAKSLLLVGSMPLLPPARREWSTVPDEAIQLTSSLSWPPLNWQTFTPDQRTLSSEYAAMSLIQRNTSFTIMDRSRLLHTFNFLVLPGSAGKLPNISAKARFYNFEVIRAIATGEDKSSPSDQLELLASFKPSQAHQDIIQKISHIPLRLQK